MATRWQRSPAGAKLCLNNGSEIDFILQQLVEDEKLQDTTAERRAARERFENLTAADNNYDGTFCSDFDAAKAALGNSWLGYASQVQKMKALCKADELEALIDVTQSHVDVHFLFEKMFGADPNTWFKSVQIRCTARRYLDADITAVSKLSFTDVQTKFRSKRNIFWRDIMVDALHTLHKSEHHRAMYWKLLANVAQSHFFDNYDPQYGLFESLVDKRLDPEPTGKQLQQMEKSIPYPMPCFGKRSIRCVVDEKMNILQKKIDDNAVSFFHSEKLIECMWKDKLQQKFRARVNASQYTRQLSRWDLCENNPSIDVIPACEEQASVPSVGIGAIEEQVDAVLESKKTVTRKTMSEAMATLEARVNDVDPDSTETFKTGEFKRLLESLEAFVKDKKNLPELAGKLFDHLLDPKVKTYSAENLGMRGIAAHCILDHDIETAAEYQFYKQCSTLLAERKVIASQIASRGFVVCRTPSNLDQLIAVFYYNAGHIVYKLLYQKRPNIYVMASCLEELNYYADFLACVEYFEGSIHPTEGAALEYEIELKNSCWLSTVAGQFQVYQTLGVEQQFAALKGLVKTFPQLTLHLFKKFSIRVRSCVFATYMDGNFTEAHMQKLLTIFSDKRKANSLTSFEIEQEAAKKKNEQRAAAADGPQNHARHTIADGLAGSKSAAVGVSRERAKIHIAVHQNNLLSGLRLLATGRPHRKCQGLQADQIRLYWHPKDYRPTKVPYSPECDTLGAGAYHTKKLACENLQKPRFCMTKLPLSHNVFLMLHTHEFFHRDTLLANFKSILLPRVLLEYGLSVGDVNVT